MTPSPPSGFGPPIAISSSPSGPASNDAHDPGADADDVPLPDVADLVVEPDAAGADDDDVGLLLLAVAVADGVAQVGRVLPVADPDVARAEGVAAEAPLQALEPALDGVVLLQQVHDRVVGHGPSA